jgi:hypothetical protein
MKKNQGILINLSFLYFVDGEVYIALAIVSLSHGYLLKSMNC